MKPQECPGCAGDKTELLSDDPGSPRYNEWYCSQCGKYFKPASEKTEKYDHTTASARNLGRRPG